MPYQIVNIKGTPGIAEKAIPWFASKWGVSLDEYQKALMPCSMVQAISPGGILSWMNKIKSWADVD